MSELAGPEWQENVADRLSEAFGDRVWELINSHWRSEHCEILAQVADFLDDVQKKVRAGIAGIVRFTVRLIGVPDIVAALIGELVASAVSLHFLQPLHGLAQMLRVTGALTCVANGCPGSCRCLRSLLKQVTTEAFKEFLTDQLDGLHLSPSAGRPWAGLFFIYQAMQNPEDPTVSWVRDGTDWPRRTQARPWPGPGETGRWTFGGEPPEPGDEPGGQRPPGDGPDGPGRGGPSKPGGGAAPGIERAEEIVTTGRGEWSPRIPIVFGRGETSGAGAEYPTAAQEDALRELRYVAEISDGRISVERRLFDFGADISALVRIVTDAPASGLLAGEESVVISIPPDYPFRRPRVRATHDRFDGLPHIQWRRAICLYGSDSDWDPSDGMFGFLSRLFQWYSRAANGMLDNADLPWDPPTAFPNTGDACIVVRTDVPDSLTASGRAELGVAVLAQVNDERRDVVDWQKAAADINRLNQMRETPEHLALVIVLPRPVGVEYPETIDDLLRTLDAQRLSRTYAQDLLDEIIEINAERGREAGTTPPITVLLASPSTRADAPHRIAHLAAWRADTDATVRWERVFDQRGQITVRRDQDRPAGWLLVRRLLILGCGALGAPAAELCLRAGAAELHLVDNGLVHPGILVRQPYDERDIGRRKAAALAESLRAIRPDARITAYAEDARDVLTGCRDWHGVDLIIDATANRTVATLLELVRGDPAHDRSALITLAVGHRAERGISTVSMPAASGGGTDVLRRIALLSGDPRLADVGRDFFPDPPRTDWFQPEYGCSSPTFRGSATDVTALAAAMLDAGLTRLQEYESEQPTPPLGASIVRMPGTEPPAGHVEHLHWLSDYVVADRGGAYQVRIDLAALDAMRELALWIARRRYGLSETGGPLYGQFDHAARIVWVTSVGGPPPDSETSPGGFVLGTSGLADAVREYRRSSADTLTFIGAWHTHPFGPPRLSKTDHKAARGLLYDRERPSPHCLVLVIGGADGQWADWLAGGHLTPDIAAHVFDRAGLAREA